MSASSAFPGGPEWLERLPHLVEECVEQWSLELEEPYPYANVSVVYPAGDVVLKVGFPHWESEHEAAALAHWGGEGAVRLHANDAERNALLLERCRPGTSLELPEESAYAVAAGVLRSWVSRSAPRDHAFTPIEVTASRWARELPERWEAAGRPFERELLEEGVRALSEAPPTQPEPRRLPSGLPSAERPRGRARAVADDRPEARRRRARVRHRGADPRRPGDPCGASTSSRTSSGSTANECAAGRSHTLAWGFEEHVSRACTSR